ncbi:MAG: primosomal protein N' [Thermoleophilia bacterium]|nr:primosomal protein N' [Thermoleophilia bacterium]
MTNALFDMPPEPKPMVAPAPMEPVIEGPAVAIYPLVPARSFDQPFTYVVPPELVGQLEVGTIVEVTVGRAARVGVVQSLDVEAPEGVRLKPVVRIVDQPPVLPSLVRLAEWVADQYGCARTVALALVVGPRLAAQARASAVPTRRRQLAVRRLVDDLGGFDLTKRQRTIAAQVPVDWVSLAALLTAIGTTRPTLGKLAEAGMLAIEERFLDELEPIPDADDIVAIAEASIVGQGSERSLVELTAAQQHAVDQCAGDAPGSADDPASLLVGITGSGKTEVYLETIARSLDQGRGAIVLVPEIALTPQTARRFLARFPGNVEVLHSAMTKAERATAHERIARGAARVVVGPRSAIFAPVRDLGIIVIDEEHDGSYKQDSEPRYDARRVAFRRALSEGARLVLGSATPRPESWHGVQRHVLLTERPGGGRLAPLEIVDLREHEDEYPLSVVVRDALEATLQRGRKAIVLHNRRGYAVALHCRECAHTFRCPRCDVSLVIHGRIARRQRLTCHHCGHDEQVPERCPECRSVEVARMGAGSEQIEKLLEERFPHQVFRLDADSVKTRGAVGEILDAFAAAGPSILVGTQMVAKGHDFPDVELAVVIDADMALNIPDFRAEERAFSIVSQLAGRAGRSAMTAEHARVMVQTRDPSHAFLGFARTHDIAGFLARELEQRAQFGFPPFGRLVRVVVSSRLESSRDQWAQVIADGMRTLDVGRVLGPAPLMRINERDRAQVIVSTHRAAEVAAAMRAFLGSSEAVRRKVDVRIALDVDPQSML